MQKGRSDTSVRRGRPGRGRSEGKGWWRPRVHEDRAREEEDISLPSPKHQGDHTSPPAQQTGEKHGLAVTTRTASGQEEEMREERPLTNHQIMAHPRSSLWQPPPCPWAWCRPPSSPWHRLWPSLSCVGWGKGKNKNWWRGEESRQRDDSQGSIGAQSDGFSSLSLLPFRSTQG